MKQVDHTVTVQHFIERTCYATSITHYSSLLVLLSGYLVGIDDDYSRYMLYTQKKNKYLLFFSPVMLSAVPVDLS